MYVYGDEKEASDTVSLHHKHTYIYRQVEHTMSSVREGVNKSTSSPLHIQRGRGEIPKAQEEDIHTNVFLVYMYTHIYADVVSMYREKAKKRDAWSRYPRIRVLSVYTPTAGCEKEHEEVYKKEDEERNERRRILFSNALHVSFTPFL